MKLEKFLLNVIDETSTMWTFSANKGVDQPSMLTLKKSDNEKIMIKSIDLNSWGVNHTDLKDGASFDFNLSDRLGRSSVTTPILYSSLTIILTNL